LRSQSAALRGPLGIASDRLVAASYSDEVMRTWV
jgi:hypothetical protein